MKNPKAQPNYYIKTEFYVNKLISRNFIKDSKEEIMLNPSFID